jgi:beta-glucosidase
MFSKDPVPDDQKYLPISLQYRPYTATTARDPSLAGDIVNGVKENRSYRGKSITASNESDLDALIALRAAMPTGKIILIVEATNNAQCFHEIEPYADVILWSWASSGRAFGPAYGRILSGEVEPSGLLPCQMPINMETVEAQDEDVPRDLACYTDSEGNTYDFCFGLNWSGVIDDDRVSTYSAKALTQPETEVTPGDWVE